MIPNPTGRYNIIWQYSILIGCTKQWIRSITSFMDEWLVWENLVCWSTERCVFIYHCRVCVCSPRISPPPRSPHCAVLCRPALSSSDTTSWASSPLHHSPLQLRQREICVKHLWNKHFPRSMYRAQIRATALSAYSQHETAHSNNVTNFRMKHCTEMTKRKCRESIMKNERGREQLVGFKLSLQESQPTKLLATWVILLINFT